MQDHAQSQGQQHLAIWVEHMERPSFVYVVRDPRGPIKVGLATDVAARIAGLQTGNPHVLELLHVVPGDRRLEWNFHKRLEADHVRGEWFEGPRVAAFLIFVERMADRMVAALLRRGEIPDYMDFGRFDARQPPDPGNDRYDAAVPGPIPTRKKWRTRGPTHAVTVRHVDPAPAVPPDEAQAMRDSVRGCSRAAYLGPANTLVHRRISPNQQ
jgi:hypothetical protein